MDTRTSAIGMVAAFFLAMVFPSVGFPDPVHIYSGNFNLPIIDKPGPGSTVTEAVIEIPDHFVIEDIDVRINITHTNVFDLQLFLQSPAGTRICLNVYDSFYDFFVGANYTNTVFDDEALFSIKEGEAPFTGLFKPVDIDPYNKLSKFDGENTCGSWRLQIYDMFDSDTGTLNSFELMITTPEPATAILLTIGVGLMRLRRPPRRSQKIINCQNSSSHSRNSPLNKVPVNTIDRTSHSGLGNPHSISFFLNS